MTDKKNILIYGSKEFSKTIRELIFSCGHNFIGFIDDFEKAEGVLGKFNEIRDRYSYLKYEIALGIGYNNLNARMEVFSNIKKAGYKISTLIHPAAYVAQSTLVNEGCMIMAGAIVDVNSSLEEIVVAWPGVVVNHDCLIGSNTFLSPNCTVCGAVKVGRNCFIGAGSVIVDHVSVPDNSFIKAGTTFK